jgi:hypothetical protein
VRTVHTGVVSLRFRESRPNTFFSGENEHIDAMLLTLLLNRRG